MQLFLSIPLRHCRCFETLNAYVRLHPENMPICMQNKLLYSNGVCSASGPLSEWNGFAFKDGTYTHQSHCQCRGCLDGRGGVGGRQW